MPDLEAFMTRIAAVEVEAMTSITVSADAVPFFFHQQERYPYFTNRLGAIEVSGDGEELDIYRVEVIARLVIAQVTDGIVRGENEARLTAYIPTFIKWVNEHELAQSAAYLVPVDDLIRVRAESCRGYTEFQPSGQIGTEFTLVAEFEAPITQAYL